MTTLVIGLALASLCVQEVEIEKIKEKAKADAKAAVMANRMAIEGMNLQVKTAVDTQVRATARAMARVDGREDDAYRRGSRAVDDRKYEEALNQFQKVIDAKGTRIEGAYYWKAYVLSKLGKRDDALASIAELKRSYAQSRWLNDAKALELEVQQNAGRGPSPESENDEELKLLAINGLLSSDPDRAVPLLEKQLNNPKNSPKLKERALFVLAQSRNAKAREIVSNYAKGASNPDLQLMAVQYMGTFGGNENRQKLLEVYQTGDPSVKRAVIRGLMVSGGSEQLLALAKSEQNPSLRREAIRGIAASGGDVGALWSANAPTETKEAVLEGLMIRSNVDKLAEIAKGDSDPKIRRSAIHMLGTQGREKSGPILTTMYAGEQDKEIRKEIMNAFFIQGNAKAMIESAKKESDPELKREAVRKLSMMKSSEASDYLVELLNK